MTINDLIEKLYNEKGANGAWNVLKYNYNDLKKLCKTRDAEEDFMSKIYLQDRIREKHAEINGFIWGLYAAGYIEGEERDELTDELLKETRKEEGNC